MVCVKIFNSSVATSIKIFFVLFLKRKTGVPSKHVCSHYSLIILKLDAYSKLHVSILIILLFIEILS